MQDEVRCPRCDAKETGHLDDMFEGRCGGTTLVKCDSCNTIFEIEQVISANYYANDTCGNESCAERTKNGQTCLKSKHGKGCKDYLPPKQMIEEWNKDTIEPYKEIPLEE